MQRWLIVLAIVVLCTGCALFHPRDSVPLAGGGDWHLLAPAQLAAPAQAIQMVEASFAGHAAVFLFYLEADAEQLVLVGTTPDVPAAPIGKWYRAERRAIFAETNEPADDTGRFANGFCCNRCRAKQFDGYRFNG
jgi:hypothetical protein